MYIVLKGLPLDQTPDSLNLYRFIALLIFMCMFLPLIIPLFLKLDSEVMVNIQLFTITFTFVYLL